jgi:hypothetical protein
MKNLLIILALFICLSSCTNNQAARSFGGTETINLESGKRLVNITWKGQDGAANLWILTKKDTTKPSTYFFEEKSGFGILEGKVIIIEN